MENISNVPQGLESEVQEPDIMSVFEESDAVNQEQPEVQSETKEEIEDRWKDLPEQEGKYRSLKSKYDKLYSYHENVLREAEENSKAKQFVEDLLADDEIFEAFVAERKPELLQKKDITAIIKEKMAQEFQDYQPSRREAEEDPGGKAWLYYKRLDELYDEQKNKKSTGALSIKELKAKRLEMEKAREMELTNVLTEVKTAMKWDDNQLKQFESWAKKLKPIEIAKMYNFAIKTMRIPSVTNLPGNSSQPSSRSSFWNSI
jgi:hypothetical protein